MAIISTNHYEAPEAPQIYLPQPAALILPPALKLFSPENPVPLQFDKGGYLGTFDTDKNLIAEADQVARQRRQAAIDGGYDVKKHKHSEEMKGAIGELFARAAYAEAAAKGLLDFSVLVAAKPDKRPDLCFKLPVELAGLVDAPQVDVKTSCERLAHLQPTRRDNWFLVAAHDLDNYGPEVSGCLFVHVVSKTRAHFAYASCSYIKTHWKKYARGTHKVAKKYDVYARPIGGMLPGRPWQPEED